MPTSDALDRFTSAVPDAKNARDVLDHFDDYASGVGNLAHPGAHRRSRTPSSVAATKFTISYERGSANHFILRFGELQINVFEASQAAQSLAEAMAALVYEPADEVKALEAFGQTP